MKKPEQHKSFSDERPLDRDGQGRQLYAEDIIAMLESELARRKEERRPLELQWILNANFQSGQRYQSLKRRDI